MRKVNYRNALAVALIALLPACSGTVFKQFDVAPGAKSLSVDATQRFLIVKKAPEGSKTDVMVCAEPSPDAGRTVAGQIAAAGVLPKGLQGQLSAERAEALASLATRTTSIQLVRDVWYRACEGVMNGLHGPEDIKKLAKGMGSLITALAAFDAIAGSPASPAVAIGHNTESEASQSDDDGGKAGGKTTSSPQFAKNNTSSAPLSAASAEAVVEIYKAFLLASSKLHETDLTPQELGLAE